MVKRVFVGSLPFNVSRTQLQELFAKFGKIRFADVIMDRMTGQSRGFGFVEFEVDAEADTAIAEMNGYRMGSQSLKVNEARERAPGGAGPRGPGSSPGGGTGSGPRPSGGFGGGSAPSGGARGPRDERAWDKKIKSAKKRPKEDDEADFGGPGGRIRPEDWEDEE